MMPIRGHFTGRRGLAISFILALLLSTTIITLSWFMGGAKTSIRPSILFRLKADYQMESAIILQFHKLKTSEGKFIQGLNQTSPRQEITPGITLQYLSRRVSPDAYNIISLIEGAGEAKTLIGRALREPSRNAEPVWILEFLPGKPEKL